MTDEQKQDQFALQQRILDILENFDKNSTDQLQDLLNLL